MTTSYQLKDEKVPSRIEILVNRFREADKSNFPDFSGCTRPLDMALWVLWIAQEKLDEDKLTAKEIALIIVEAQDISKTEDSITRSLSRASDKVHRYYEKDKASFKIMKPGKDYLLSLEERDLVNAIYFEPGRKFTAKKLLRNQVLDRLRGNLKIVDPYCSVRTLDILGSIENRDIKLLTKLDNLGSRQKEKLVREITDFKSENKRVEIRDYPNADIHDRYVISELEVAIIGHSIKDLGTKETFAVILNIEGNRDIYSELNGNFVRKWEISTEI